jgi:hypothetical protein
MVELPAQGSSAAQISLRPCIAGRRGGHDVGAPCIKFSKAKTPDREAAASVERTDACSQR